MHLWHLFNTTDVPQHHISAGVPRSQVFVSILQNAEVTAHFEIWNTSWTTITLLCACGPISSSWSSQLWFISVFQGTHACLGSRWKQRVCCRPAEEAVGRVVLVDEVWCALPRILQNLLQRRRVVFQDRFAQRRRISHWSRFACSLVIGHVQLRENVLEQAIWIHAHWPRSVVKSLLICVYRVTWKQVVSFCAGTINFGCVENRTGSARFSSSCGWCVKINISICHSNRLCVRCDQSWVFVGERSNEETVLVSIKERGQGVKSFSKRSAKINYGSCFLSPMHAERSLMFKGASLHNAAGPTLHAHGECPQTYRLFAVAASNLSKHSYDSQAEHILVWSYFLQGLAKRKSLESTFLNDRKLLSLSTPPKYSQCNLFGVFNETWQQWRPPRVLFAAGKMLFESKNKNTAMKRRSILGSPPPNVPCQPVYKMSARWQIFQWDLILENQGNRLECNLCLGGTHTWVNTLSCSTGEQVDHWMSATCKSHKKSAVFCFQFRFCSGSLVLWVQEKYFFTQVWPETFVKCLCEVLSISAHVHSLCCWSDIDISLWIGPLFSIQERCVHFRFQIPLICQNIEKLPLIFLYPGRRWSVLHVS